MNTIKTILITGFVLVCDLSYGQWALSITPVIGLNSTRINLHKSFAFEKFTKGGNYLLIGIETEFRLSKNKPNRFGVSAVTGCSYLANGFYYHSGFTLSDLIYSYEKTELNTKYIQFPLELKLNWQPFPLMEDFFLFAGAGLSGSVLQSAHLAEEGIYSIFSMDVMTPPPTTNYYADQADITNLGRKLSFFRRWELGGRYKKIQFSLRVSQSLQDMYFKGLENNWAVPVDRSRYLSGRELNGKILEKYVEVVFGYKIF